MNHVQNNSSTQACRVGPNLIRSKAVRRVQLVRNHEDEKSPLQQLYAPETGLIVSNREMDLQWIEDLTKNNDAPSSVAFQEVKSKLQKPLEDLNNLDVEILSLEKRLEELKAKRAESQQWLTPYQSIISPIRRVPTDVLSEIFQRCLHTHRNPIIKTAECPMLLTHICRKWRALAINDSRLWSRLHTTFSDDDMVPVDEDHLDPSQIQATFLGTFSQASKDRATQMLRMRMQAVREWISRSGTTPLSISLRFTTNFTRDTPHCSSDSTHNLTIEFFAFLAALSPRLESLEVKMPIKIYRILEGLMNTSEMKALKSFRADFYSQLLNRQEGWASPIAFLSAPNLRQVSMFGHENRIWGTPATSRDWSRLTHMSVHTPSSIAEITDFLEHSPNLVHFQGNIAENLDDINGNPIVPYQYQGNIHLPFLRTLHLCDDADPRRTGNLYGCINAPLLHWVTYLGRFRPHMYSADNLPPIPIILLLLKSPGIRRLNIDSLDNTVWGINRIFRAVPNLTHLVIGPDSRSPKGSLIRTAPVYISPRLRQTPWDLGGLLVDDLNDPAQNINGDYPLLPNLETLEISSHSGYLPDEKLKNFIISRLSPSLSQKITNLKRVEIVFYREKEIDAEAEIRKHAEFVDADLELVLNYVKKLVEPMRSSAPSFGLHDPEGRSWCLGEFAEMYDENMD